MTSRVWGSAVNPEAKLLLLGHAFEALGAGRVQLKTDVRNQRSQRAIERMGARHEGKITATSGVPTTPCATPCCSRS